MENRISPYPGQERESLLSASKIVSSHSTRNKSCTAQAIDYNCGNVTAFKVTRRKERERLKDGRKQTEVIAPLINPLKQSRQPRKHLTAFGQLNARRVFVLWSKGHTKNSAHQIIIRYIWISPWFKSVHNLWPQPRETLDFKVSAVSNKSIQSHYRPPDLSKEALTRATLPVWQLRATAHRRSIPEGLFLLFLAPLGQ